LSLSIFSIAFYCICTSWQPFTECLLVVKVVVLVRDGTGRLSKLNSNPYQKQDINALEKVQMRATMLVTALCHNSFQEQ